MTIEAFFLPAANRQRFCVYHAPVTDPGASPKGRIVYVHPFAEEMNKSRRMAALQSRALSKAGFGVLQVDLHGCGDSSGDFGDATWSNWMDDVTDASHWLHKRIEADFQNHGTVPLWLWGLRAGCLLAVQAAQTLHEPCNFLFWAPSPGGKPLLQQFLRLKAASDLASGNAKGVMESLRGHLAGGQNVEVAGYKLTPSIASGLEQAQLLPPDVGCSIGRVEWFELSNRPDADFTPVAVKCIADWQKADYTVRPHLVKGPPFWQTTEIEDAPDLIELTLANLSTGSAS